MEKIQRLVRSLRTARAADLPTDPQAAISTLLPLIMRNDHKTVAELLLSSDFDVNYRIRAERTLLHIAANVGAYDCLVILIKKDANVDCQDRSGVTPLQLAARNGHTKCIHKLLESKADIGICNSDGMTALHWIASNGRTELLNAILPFINNIDIKDVNRQTPLHLACFTGHKSTVQKLMENNADFEMVDARGYTSLFYACSHGHADIVSYLLSKGAKFSKNYDDISPLQIALENGHKEVCFVLIDWRNSLLENLLILAQDCSIPEEKALSALRYIAGMKEEFHRAILIRLADRSRVAGLELLSASSDYDKTQTAFFKPLSLLCNMSLLSPEDLLERPRLGSNSITARSRLRTLTGGAPQNSQQFKPPAGEIQETLSSLWSSLENWFILIKDEIRRAPTSGSAKENQGAESAIPKECDDVDSETRFIASELVRSNPINISVRPRSTASIESILLSQPALEFNMARQSGDLNSSRGLHRDLSLRLMQRSISSNQPRDPGSLVLAPETRFIDNDTADEAPAHANIGLNISEDAMLSPVDENETPATENVVSTVTDSHTQDESLPSYNDNARPLEERDASLNISDNENPTNNTRPRRLVRRSISYTNAVVGESQSLDGPDIERQFLQQLSREASIEDHSTGHIDRFLVPHYSGAVDTKFASTGAESDKSDEKVNMIERFADRLCAVVHGYHLASFNCPYWESARKSQIRKSGFQEFIERNEEVLQLFVARKPKLIFDHFQFVLDSPLLLQRYLPVIHKQPFTERLDWFYENLHNDQNPTQVPFDEKSLITVTRDALLLSSCDKLLERESDVLKRNLAVRFEGEAGMGEGVVREWLDLLFKEVLNPDYALFTLSADGSTFQPNSNSAVNSDHLNYFCFAGRMMGLAMYHKRLISASFTRSFYKHILGIPVDYKDVASMDPDYAKNLQWILDNDISNLGLDLTFAVETKEFGQVKLEPLKPGGCDILVTDENKEEYVQLAADMKMTKAIKPQIYSFLEGFHEFIPHSLVALFNECELELILSGVQEIDFEDWKNNTLYQAGYDAESQQVKWFWETVEDFDQQERSLLLQFVTGSSRVPWGGFASLIGASGPQKFTISSTASLDNVLPSASTCFNLLKLPEYSSKEDLVEKLKTALKHGVSGFEFA
ncbi:E3 ubiquitin-protein ligase HACE1-like [Rhopilema esculentum]|uniref:E3 ubiquitin-protein ligase HACE1-like n=1 Tax=Rhopilema esculentum TaxID=499914 RepID=UPI0031E27C28|eukprot:gene10460-19170_t